MASSHPDRYSDGEGHSQVLHFRTSAISPPTGNVVGVGIDLADVSAVRRSIDQFGARYLARLFTSAEQTHSAESSDPAPHLAARFAAKEATIKALTIDGPVPPWTSMEVRRGPTGSYRMHLTGSAARIAKDKGIDGLMVSLSHEADMAIAIVVAIAGDRDRRL